jgi:hypothetical protein
MKIYANAEPEEPTEAEAEEGDEPITAAEAADLLFSSARLAEALGRRLLDPKRTAANPEYTRKLLNPRWLCAVADVMCLPRFPE